MFDDAGPIFLSDPVARHHPLNRGRVAWLLAVPGIDGGRQWFDLMGLNHGTLNNMTASGWRGTTRPGGFGHLLFDGVDDYVRITDRPSLKPTTITLGCWLWMTSNPGSVSVPINKYQNSGAFAGYSLRVTTGGKLGIWVGDSAWTDGVTTVTGGWHHCVGTYDGTTAKVYVDGALDGSQAQSGNLSAAVDLGIGAVLDGGVNNLLAGAIDDVFIMSRAVSAAEAFALYEFSRRGYRAVLSRLSRTYSVPAASTGAALRRRILTRAA